MQIDFDFPGGNIVVERVEDRDVWVHQDLRDTVGNWFYWCFRVRGAAGTTRRFHFTRSRAIGVRGPAVSMDHGRTWRWLGAPREDDPNEFTFTFPEEARDVRLSFAMPYQAEQWEAVCTREPIGDRLAREELCRSRKGRRIEYARMGCLDAPPAHRVAITCRHHCCEMMASYALEGLIAYVLADGGHTAAWLRGHVEFFVVPFVDLDGVEDGDQGKNRRPHDHARDYTGESIYPCVRTLREILPQWSEGCLTAALDLHCPHIARGMNEKIYLVGSPTPRIEEAQKIFSRVLQDVARGGLPFRADDFLPFGTAWNTDRNFSNGVPFARWAGGLPGIRLASGMEIPYATVYGVEMNQQAARSFGVDLGRALAAYLQSTVEA